MQHCTKVPLLLNNIRHYTVDPNEQHQLTESLEKLETSLRMYPLRHTYYNLSLAFKCAIIGPIFYNFDLWFNIYRYNVFRVF